MSEIPDFKSTSDYDVYITLFEEKLTVYATLFNKVKQFLNLDYIDGHVVTSINDITRSLTYDTSSSFKVDYPQYKTEDDELFIPYRCFKENVTEALKDALAADRCPPCDELACTDHLGD